MTQPSPRQPIFNIPASIVLLIVLMGAIHAGRILLSDARDAEVLERFAFVPGRFTMAFDPAAVLAPLRQIEGLDQARDTRVEIARFFLGDGRPQIWTVLTYALLHGSWTHFGLNSIWLLAFGTPVARRFGAFRFLLFFAAGAVAGAATHYAVDPIDLQPLIGASASVSACMAAALRFMFRSGRAEAADVRAGDRAPRRNLIALVGDRRVMAFVVVWFVTNLVTGVGAVRLGFSDAPIAWQAHIGGFVFGLLVFPLFDPVRRAEPIVNPAEENA